MHARSFLPTVPSLYPNPEYRDTKAIHLLCIWGELKFASEDTTKEFLLPVD